MKCIVFSDRIERNYLKNRQSPFKSREITLLKSMDHILKGFQALGKVLESGVNHETRSPNDRDFN